MLASLMFVAVTPVTRAVSPSDPVPVEPLPPDVTIETVVSDANQVVAMDFTPDGRLLYTERNSGYDGSIGSYMGDVRVVVDGQLQPDPVYRFPVDVNGERGLLGLAVDPNFNNNHAVWIYLTRDAPPFVRCSGLTNRIIRFTLNDDNTVGSTDLAGCFRISQYVTVHNGGNLHFGPDGKLYVTVGNNNTDNSSSDPAQKLNSPLGKIHRFNPTVRLSAPSDNPFYNTPNAVQSIYAFGLRNSFDFVFDPVSGHLFATENGDACDDEINLILPGGNYGWRPTYPCDDEAPAGPDPAYNTIPPLIYWTPSLAPTGLTVYTGDAIPEWKNDLFMCSFKDETTALHHFELNAARTAIVSHTVIEGVHCRTDLLTGPDGALYFSEEGGWYAGPIKRITRATSFALSSVDAQPAALRAGDALTYTLHVRHAGTLSNTFALTATIPASAALSAGSPHSQFGVLTHDADHVYWSGTLSRTQAWSATYQVSVTGPVTTPYVLTSTIALTAPGLDMLTFTPAVIVNGYQSYLPIVWHGS